MSTHRQRLTLGAAVLLALLLIGSYQLWAGALQDRTETKIVRTTSTCAQVDRLYSAIVKLAQDDPRFSAGEVLALVNQRGVRLAVQGCKP